MATGGFLQTFEANLSILCNSLPMLLPLYSYWRYRRFYGEGEDEYVSRIGGGDNSLSTDVRAAREQRRVFVNMTNGLPLEIDPLYGQDHYFTTRVELGESTFEMRHEHHKRTRSKGTLRLGRQHSMQSAISVEGGPNDSESTRALQSSSGSAGITIETKWTIVTEDNRKTYVQ